MVQSGFSEDWWPEVMACYCFSRNIVDILANGNTVYKNRFNEVFRKRLDGEEIDEAGNSLNPEAEGQE